MGRFSLARKVRSDLSEIWHYSAERWGADRADRYIRDIWSTFEKIAESPKRGRLCDEAGPGHLKMITGSHIVVYRVIDEEVSIVRVLHQAMDISLHF
jgi:toxin ParE1/3/4